MSPTGSGDVRPGIRIDADLHNVPASVKVLYPFLPEFWVEQLTETGFSGATADPYPEAVPTTCRPGARPPSGARAGSDFAILREQALDASGVDYGILNCAYAVDSIKNPDAASAMASALNQWQVAEWLDRDPRLRASIVVPSQDPDVAAAEIERAARHQGFVQVFLPARSAIPYGRRSYHKVFQAAIDHGLAVSIQYGGFPGNPPTSVGWPSYLIEEYVGMAAVMQSQLMSLIVEGVFDKFPDLRVALVEGGFTWLPSFMWRLDKDWKGLRREVPWVRRPPSEYIRDHVRLTAQPVDTPVDRPEILAEILGQMWGDELLMFSTDYPHWHFDDPKDALPVSLPSDELDRIMGTNAQEFYRLS